MIAYALIAAFALLLIFGAVRDVQSFTIPNWISIAAALLFIPAALAAGIGWTDFGLHAATGIVVLLTGMAAFAFGWLGGGDVKLLAAASLWMGWPDILPYMALVAVLGGAFTLFLMAARRKFGPVADGFGLSMPILQRTGDIPYGVAIAAGALIFLGKSAFGAALIAASA